MFDGMAMCFYTANCPFHLAGGVYKIRAHFKKRPTFSPFYSGRPSSIILQTEGNENYPQSKGSDLGSALMGSGSSNLILNHGNTVGIIGGLSALSTIGFLEKLVKWSIKDGEESPPFVVCNDPFLNREIASGERKFAPYTRLRNTHNQFDVALVVDNLKHKRVFLENLGAGCIVMPCYISNAWHNEISQGCSVPFLHIGECVAKELKEANLKPVETGSNLQIGVLAPYPTLTIGFYQEKLQDQGFEVVVPDEATMEHTVIPAMEALNRKDIEGARNLLRIALQVLLVRAVNTIILASDDMRSLLPPNDPLLKKCTDPMDALARSTLQWVKSRA